MSEAASVDARMLYCCFRLGERTFAVPTAAVKEVHAALPITPVPGTPSAILGYVNLRGLLHMVLDPRGLLVHVQAAPSDDGPLIVFQGSVGEAFAIAVDALAEMRAVDQDQIDVLKEEPGQLAASRDAEPWILGHARFEDFLVTLINPEILYTSCFSELNDR